jgi:hypothetical protein
MRAEHRDVQAWIKKRYGLRYAVAAEIDAQNQLPDASRHWYQPDVVMRNGDGEIEYIVEVEGDPMRKSIVGASMLAEASVHALDQHVRPTLIFVIYKPEGIKQMHNFLAKVEIIKPYCHALRDIQVVEENEFKRLKL